ncbi:MAG: endopeptidase La [Saprospiraceae bacterium]|jgi:ATP-dependent Lon protease|nr:endopeptidase La [Saprospiraceae bacterium]
MQDEQVLRDPEAIEDILVEEQQLQRAEHTLPRHLTILPLTQRPIFPGLPIPLTFSGKEKTALLQKIFEQEDGYVGLVLARSFDEEDETQSDLYEVGTLYQIQRIIPAGPGVVQVLGRSITRFSRLSTLLVKPQIRWDVQYHFEPKEKPDPDLKAYMLAISSEIKQLLQLNPMFQEQVNLVVAQLNYEAPGMTMDVISNLLSGESEQLQELLETFNWHERAKLLLQLIKEELEIARIQQKINKQIEEKVNKQQKEFFLREQLKAIRKELGMDKEDGESEVEKIAQKLAHLELPEDVLKVVQQEINKLRTLNAQSPDFNLTRNYLETIAELPWSVYSADNTDIRKARESLDTDHYGLTEVKERILEFLSAVIKRGKIAGSIICLVGPPGVGKTSIGKSVAAALDRKFFRFSVGGMRDEAEIKGHRRTYIGAMPGKIIQALQRVGAANPVIMLDEIDKIGSSFRGDPASALLEVLDPEQNASFLDHYLDLPFDLSNVLFITTANQLDTIPQPLLDRMEVIRLSGYMLQEKVQIALQYLVPKQLEEHGFQPDEMAFSTDALHLIVDKYAREAGVRNLEKQIRKIIRKVSLKLAEHQEVRMGIEAADVAEYLGQPIFSTEQLYEEAIPGVVLGLAYTSMGGATLYIEAAGIKSKHPGFKQTGQLGDVMRESSEIALSFVRARLCQLPACADFFDQHSVHLHVPAGATPKDGPSAGITMALALFSLAYGKAVKPGIAMTGELTLTGRVLPIGGVREKTLAARRVGIKELIFPAENQKDFDELPDYIKEGLEVHFVRHFEEVLKIAYPNDTFQ